jgi:hypothetical protein
MGKDKKNDDDPPTSPFEDVQEDIDDLTRRIEELDDDK